MFPRLPNQGRPIGISFAPNRRYEPINEPLVHRLHGQLATANTFSLSAPPLSAQQVIFVLTINSFNLFNSDYESCLIKIDRSIQAIITNLQTQKINHRAKLDYRQKFS